MNRHHGARVGWHTGETLSDSLGNGWRHTADAMCVGRTGGRQWDKGLIATKPFRDVGGGDGIYQERAKIGGFLAPALAFYDVGTAPGEDGGKATSGMSIEGHLLDCELRW